MALFLTRPSNNTRRKLFNIRCGGGGGQSQRDQLQYLGEGDCQMFIHPCMHACKHTHMYASMHMHIHAYIYIFTS